jgi:hypothetical protein
MPGPETGIIDSQVGRKLIEIYDSGPNLLATGASTNDVRVYASFTGSSYDINSWQRAQRAELESAELNFLPEPSPLALLVTGLVCIFFAKGFRRFRRSP